MIHTQDADFTLAYLAGIIDADGTIGIKRNRGAWGDTYSERVCVRQVETQAVELLHATFGGYLGIAKSYATNGRPLNTWEATDRKAATCLLALLPYLRIKRDQALNALELRKVKERSKVERVAFGRGHVGGSPRRPETTAHMQRLRDRAGHLNAVGRR